MRFSAIISFISLACAFHNLNLAIYMMLVSIGFRISEDACSICEFLKVLISLNEDEEDE